jgi:hypothetical protein
VLTPHPKGIAFDNDFRDEKARANYGGRLRFGENAIDPEIDAMRNRTRRTCAKHVVRQAMGTTGPACEAACARGVNR